tara:strand:- start:773 stop:1363 length:591 start_codon:yes stop_codon:yes gene_type:complete
MNIRFKQFTGVAIASSFLLLGGCSSMSGNGSSTSMLGLKDTPENSQREDMIPNWFINLPRDGEEKVYGSGSGLSSDLQFAIDKAIHQAKTVLGDKISNEVSSELRTYMADNSNVGNGITVEETQKVSKSGYKNIDISAYEITNKEVFKEEEKFRAYILLEIDPRGRKKTKKSAAVVVTKEELDRAQDKARESLNNL